MEEDRLWKFSRPEWLNSIWARNAGVYGSGALVSDHRKLQNGSQSNVEPSMVISAQKS